jgi:uncharacterized protein (TIGR03086 family)
MTSNDLRPLHLDALARADGVVRRVVPSDLGGRTPCAAWGLGELLAHMVGQHHGFATAVVAGDAPDHAYEPRPFEPVAWADSIEVLGAAFAAADLDAHVHQVELRADGTLPVRFLVAAQLLDTVVHTWDVARSLGGDHRPPDEVVDVVAAIADAIPASSSEGDRAAFAPPRAPVPGDPWARALARLGRDVAWRR